MSSKSKTTPQISIMCPACAAAVLVAVSLLGAVHVTRAQNGPAEQVIHNFRPATGQFPAGAIPDPAGNLYVPTTFGGGNQTCHGGCGSILEFTSSSQPKTLYTFANSGYGDLGPHPNTLTRDLLGNLYASTQYGGHNHSTGSIFKLSPSGKGGVLYSFLGGEDGSLPLGSVALDPEGNLYGTTATGGGTGCSPQSGCGIVYKVTSSGSEAVLYRFMDGPDGAFPEAGPILDSAGNLYGTTVIGGDLNCVQGRGAGCGTVWKLDPSGSLSVLYTFTGGADGAASGASLVMDTSGNLYGVASEGGNLSCNGGLGCGVVFEISSSGNFTALYTFGSASADGQFPENALFRDGSGNLYGTTVEGGDLSCTQGGGSGCGAVFKLDTSNNETILHAFTGGTTDGWNPNSTLFADGKGSLYGTTNFGGLLNGGVIYKVQMQ